MLDPPQFPTYYMFSPYPVKDALRAMNTHRIKELARELKEKAREIETAIGWDEDVAHAAYERADEIMDELDKELEG